MILVTVVKAPVTVVITEFNIFVILETVVTTERLTFSVITVTIVISGKAASEFQYIDQCTKLRPS